MRLSFVKMEGAGNDYIYVDATADGFAEASGSRLARLLADRHFGVGGDGLIVLAPSRTADVRMLMWNADGSRGSMCGNGVRCLAKLAHDRGLIGGPALRVETDVGVVAVELLFAAREVVGARVAMGPVRFGAPQTVAIDGREWTFHLADVGNPHAVAFVGRDPRDEPVLRVGEALQEAFPGGINVEVVEVRRGPEPPVPGWPGLAGSRGGPCLLQRTFERGSGETLACGSGATAAACVAMARGLLPGPRVTVQLLGGELVIEQTAQGAVLEGPARTVFHGEIELPGSIG